MNKKLVMVVWNDAQDHGSQWVGADDAETFANSECTIMSVGFIVRKTDKYITIAGDYDEIDNDYGRVTKIPTGMVESIKDITF